MNRLVLLFVGAALLAAQLSAQVSRERFRIAPPGPTPSSLLFEAVDGPVPIDFLPPLDWTITKPTAAVWGPDGRLYVTSLGGRIWAMEFDASYALQSVTEYPGLSLLSNHDTLGIAINPFDPPSPLRLYVSHAELFADGGTTPMGPSAYTGQISVLEGPSFDAPIPLVTGFPTSNHGHAVNGMVFNHNGDLLVEIGGNTNAGVQHPNIGDLPESPLTGAVVKVLTSKPSGELNGTIAYMETIGGAPSTDQRDGEDVDVAPDVDIRVHATGLRNLFGLVFTTRGRLYATDNGPNNGFGAESTGAGSEGPHPSNPDELLLVERGSYYGHPNRARGRYAAWENVYYPSSTGSSIPEVFAQAVTTLSSSTNGIDEYRSDVFQGQLRGQLIVQRWHGDVSRLELTDNGRVLISANTVGFLGALGLLTGPGGAIIGLDYSSNKVRVLRPDDVSAFGLVVHDIWPWRAPSDGGYPFVIAGVGFGTLGNTTVTVGGMTATIDSVTSQRITGTFPFNPAPTRELVDVIVDVNGESDVHEASFRWLFPTPGQELGTWDALTNVPVPLGEVSAGVIDGIMYLVGEGSNTTQAFDLVNEIWLAPKAQRPYPGHHHSAEVVDGKLYLIGGLSGGSAGKVQIYDPMLDSWTAGTDMPWGAGSVSSAVIDGEIYVAGGIVGTFTVNNHAVYDPVGDSWTALASMPAKRNHTAAATDGSRLFIFGGRTGGNFVGNGFDELQVYNPATGTWRWTGDVMTPPAQTWTGSRTTHPGAAPAGAPSGPVVTQIGSTLAPLPIGRGGMGKAVYMDGEFYVFGGETLNGPGATPSNVYDRVDVYNPITKAWRLDETMETPRHGISPVPFQGKIYVAGGGTNSGFGQSVAFDVFTRQ